MREWMYRSTFSWFKYGVAWLNRPTFWIYVFLFIRLLWTKNIWSFCHCPKCFRTNGSVATKPIIRNIASRSFGTVLKEQICFKRHPQIVYNVDFHLVTNPFSFNSFLAEIFYAVSRIRRELRETVHSLHPVNVAIKQLALCLEVPISIIGPETSYPDSGFAWFPPGLFRTIFVC
jgi:hypothetical protein